MKWGKTMKLKYSEKQYIQMAKENFTKVLAEIPFLYEVDIASTKTEKDFGSFCVLAKLRSCKEPIRFLVEVKSKGEKRFVQDFIRQANECNKDDCCVFVAPYFSEESTETMRNKQYSYMDLSGNFFILTNRIMLSASGKVNKFVDVREKKNYLTKASSAASAILRTMLNEPERMWKVVPLAKKTKKAIGTVSNVKRFLLEKDWLEETKQGFRIKNVNEMLHVWARDYHKKEARTYEFYSLSDIPKIEDEISRWTSTHDESAVLGGFSAASRYAPTVRYKKIEVYVEQKYFDEFIKDMDLQPVNSGGNVIIIVPHDETPCMYSQVIHHSLVTSPEQTIIDLLGNPSRGGEAAEAIVLKKYASSQK